MTYTLTTTLAAGDTTTDGATVVVCTQLGERRPGDTYATWVAICVRPSWEFHPFVVAQVTARPDGFTRSSGDYVHTLTEAITVYRQRGGDLV